MANAQEAHNEYLVEAISKNPKLLKDKLWRMNNLYWITTKDGTKEVFKMNRAQLDFSVKYLIVEKPYHRHIILKSRQLGFTTFIDLFILDEILFNPNKEGLIIAHKVTDAAEIFSKKVDFAVRNFCEELQQALFVLKRNSAKKIQVSIEEGTHKGSISGITVSISGRGGTNHYLHVSELAAMCVLFPKRANDLEQSTFPSVPFDGYIFLESTAEGAAGRFYEIFNDGWLIRHTITPMLSRVKFMPHFYNWTWDDMELKKITEAIPVENMEGGEIDWGEYQKEHGLTDIEITYYYMKWLQLGKNISKLRQEYPTTAEEAFVSTGQTYFPTTKVVSMLATAKKGIRGELIPNEKGDIIFQETATGRLEVFEKPEQGTQYVVGGDTAEGLAHGDAQVLYVVNHKTENCAAIYHSQEPPDEFARTAYQVGKYYNWALLAIESNKDGLWVNDNLEKAGYLNLYSRKIFDDITQKATKMFGWKTTSATRPFLLASLKAVFLRKTEGFPAQLLGEMLSFIRNQRGRPEAMQGKHDDCFVKNTLILTDKGNVPIQNVKVGDFVMTRKGLRPVIATKTKYKHVIKNLNLVGTPDHPIITEQKEVKFDIINDSAILYIWNQSKQKIEKLSYIKAKNIIDTQIHQEDNTEFIFGDMINGENHLLHYIGKFGLILMEKYQKSIIFIIKMVTHLIILLKIWNVYLIQIMLDIICFYQKGESYQEKLQRNKDSDFSMTFKNGEKLKKQLISSNKMYAVLFILKTLEMFLVVFVKLLLNLFYIMLFFVVNVVRLFQLIEKPMQKRKVYNLQIFDVPEYFANNILVHNCVISAGIAYSVLQEYGKFMETKQEDQGSHLKIMFGE